MYISIYQFNLGWKLVIVVKGYALPALLPSYQIERILVISVMLEIATELFDRTFGIDTANTQRKLTATHAAEQAGMDANATARGRSGSAAGSSSSSMSTTTGARSSSMSASLAGRARRSRMESRGRMFGLATVLPWSSTGTACGCSIFVILGPAHHTMLLFDVSEKEVGMINVVRALLSGLVKVSAPGEV